MSNEYEFYQVGDSIEITVPETYRHETYLSEFRKLARGYKAFYMSDDITPSKYPQASQHLVPGMHLRVSVIGVKTSSPVRISKCIKYLIAEGAVFTNMHGLLLVFRECPDLFVPGFAYHGLDFPEMLPPDSVDTGKGILRKGYRHPVVSVPPIGRAFPRSISHSLTEKIGPLTRFLKFELI